MKKRKNKRKIKLDCLIKRVYIGRVNDGSDFAALRARYEKELAEAENRARVLKAKLSNLSESERDSRLPVKSEMPHAYADLGPTDAILRAVSELSRQREHRDLGASVFAIKDWMLKNGFRPRGHQFDIAVSVTLKRLRDSGRVKGVSLSGDNFYKPVEE